MTDRKQEAEVQEVVQLGIKPIEFKFICIALFTYCFKAALQKAHFRNVHGKIHLVNHVKI